MLTLALALAFTLDPPRPEVEQDRLMATLSALPAARSAMGGPDGVAGIDRAESMLVERLKELGYQPRLETVRWALPARHWPGAKDEQPPADGKKPPREIPAHATPPRAWHNILVDLPGRELPAEILLVGAHYDAAPGAPGADDNGTGVAALLEVARVLKDRPLKRTVRLAFFTLEEVGLVGSMAHARSYRAPEPGEPKELESTPPQAPTTPGKLFGMISLEMLGYYSDAPGSQKSPIQEIKGVFTPPTVGDFLAAVTLSTHSAFCRRVAAAMESAAPGLKIFPFDVLPLPVPDMVRSDHAPFLAAGVPAIMLTDTANFRNPNYHKASDTVATIDPARFTLAARGLAGAVEALAEPVTPQK